MNNRLLVDRPRWRISLPMNRSSSLLESVLMMVRDANAASELVLQRSRFCFRFIASLPRCLAHHLSLCHSRDGCHYD